MLGDTEPADCWMGVETVILVAYSGPMGASGPAGRGKGR
jgi:hypothetical protein